MRKTCCFLGLLFVFTPSLPVHAAETYVPVGDYGDPDRLTIHGAEAIAPEKVKSGLQGDLEVLLAAHPAASVLSYVETLRRRTLTGYRHYGFPDVEATVRHDSENQRLIVAVKEGRRYTAGEVEIAGNRTIAAARLVELLTQPRPPRDAIARGIFQPDGKPLTVWVDQNGEPVKMEDPFWRLGKPAPFDRVTCSRLERQLARGLADLGYYSTTFDLRVVPNTDNATARLVIDILDEGPQAILREVEIEGNEKNSRQEIFEYAGLEQGMLLDRETCVRIQRRLRRSGRFIKSEVTPSVSAAGDGKVKLTIQLIEYSEAPPLSKPLSQEEQILLKFRDRLMDFEKWEEDLVISAVDRPLQCIYSPRRGVLFRYSEGAENDPAAATNWVLVLSPEQIGIYSTARRKKLVAPVPRMQLVANCSLSLTENVDKPFSLKLSFGGKSLESGQAPGPFRPIFSADPAFFVAHAHAHDAECRLDNGELTIESSISRLRIDAATGRLLEQVILPEKDGPPVARLYFEQGAFERRLSEIMAVAANFPNEYQARRPIGSTLAFLCEDEMVSKLLQLEPRVGRAAQALLRTLDQDVFEPLDQAFAKVVKDGEDRFSIPSNHPKADESAESWSEAGAAWLALRANDKVFPRGSWPWTLTREVASITLGQKEHAQKTLKKLAAHESIGPLGCALLGILLERMNPQAARAFAARGLQRLSDEDFRGDCRVLFHPDYVTGKFLRWLVQLGGKIGDEDARVIAESLLDENATRFLEYLEIVRERRDEPADEVISTLLDAIWQGGLRRRVESALRSMKDPPSLERQEGLAGP